MHARLDTDSISTQPMAMGVTADFMSATDSRQSDGANYQRVCWPQCCVNYALTKGSFEP